jgi:hypothetical protein
MYKKPMLGYGGNPAWVFDTIIVEPCCVISIPQHGLFDIICYVLHVPSVEMRHLIFTTFLENDNEGISNIN